jgi:predicted nicotinamide N-methyase
MTASDCHPLAGEFLAENVRLNGLPPLKYRHGQWGRLPFEDDASVAAPAPSLDADVSGRFELIIGSDILYERDEGGALADFIESHAAASSEVWVVDPNRGNRAHFHRNMTALGFTLVEEKINRPSDGDEEAYKGRMLTYSRALQSI